MHFRERSDPTSPEGGEDKQYRIIFDGPQPAGPFASGDEVRRYLEGMPEEERNKLLMITGPDNKDHTGEVFSDDPWTKAKRELDHPHAD